VKQESTAENNGQIARLLLDWFAKNARDLPWRKTNDPYSIWISEIMLQQTQVKTVIPYWLAWLKEFPDVSTLAQAPLERVLKRWEGLGYYTRARNLHRAAQDILTLHQGRFPQSFDLILALPGVGRYTAGAIFSIAFNQPAPILDGNVIRVLARLGGIAGDPRSRETNNLLWRRAEELIQIAATLPSHNGERHCSFLNQALMELGATICSPKQPACPICPVQSFCVAWRTSRVQTLPELPQRVAATQRRFLAMVCQRRSSVWIRQRPAGIVNAGLWEFPNVDIPLNATRIGRWIKSFNVEPKSAEALCVINHTITRYRICLEVHRARVDPSFSLAEGRWCKISELATFSFPSAHKKIAVMLQKELAAQDDY
jgi:A/G-specific adenine glycosylase